MSTAFFLSRYQFSSIRWKQIFNVKKGITNLKHNKRRFFSPPFPRRKYYLHLRSDNNKRAVVCIKPDWITTSHEPPFYAIHREKTNIIHLSLTLFIDIRISITSLLPCFPSPSPLPRALSLKIYWAHPFRRFKNRQFLFCLLQFHAGMILNQFLLRVSILGMKEERKARTCLVLVLYCLAGQAKYISGREQLEVKVCVSKRLAALLWREQIQKVRENQHYT